MTAPAGRALWVVRDVLDRQIVDRDDRAVGKVDDLEITLETGDLPVVVGLVVGLSALGHRFGRRTGGFLDALRNLYQRDTPRPPTTLPTALITEVDSVVRVGVRAGDLDVLELEGFLGRHVIGHIPGSGTPGGGS